MRDHLSRADAVAIAAIEAGAPTLVEACAFINRFHAMIDEKIEADLDAWIARAGPSLIASFASGVSKDKAAIRAAIAEPWSNGRTEGRIARPKLVKRQMYGMYGRRRSIFFKPD